MKLLLVVLVAFAATTAFQFTKRQTSCTVPDISFTCSDIDGPCWVGIIDNATSVCREGAYCDIPSNDTTGTCKAILGGDCTTFPIGTSCSAPRMTRYATCNSGNDLCEMDTAVSAANDGCGDSADCVGGMNCTNNVCVGFEIDEPCDPTLLGDDCAYGLYCAANNTCQTATAIGNACSSPTECITGAFCSGGNCVDLYTGTNGGSCNGLASAGCGPGLTCVANTCEPEITTMDFCDGPGMNCSAPQVCSCTNDQFRCVGGQEGISQPCFDQSRAYLTCIRDNQCRNLDTVLRTGAKASCANRMCEIEFACTVECSAGPCPFASNANLITQCNAASNTGPSSTGTGTGTTDGSGSTGTSKGFTLENWLM